MLDKAIKCTRKRNHPINSCAFDLLYVPKHIINSNDIDKKKCISKMQVSEHQTLNVIV